MENTAAVPYSFINSYLYPQISFGENGNTNLPKKDFSEILSIIDKYPEDEELPEDIQKEILIKLQKLEKDNNAVSTHSCDLYHNDNEHITLVRILNHLSGNSLADALAIGNEDGYSVSHGFAACHEEHYIEMLNKLQENQRYDLLKMSDAKGNTPTIILAKWYPDTLVEIFKNFNDHKYITQLLTLNTEDNEPEQGATDNKPLIVQILSNSYGIQVSNNIFNLLTDKEYIYLISVKEVREFLEKPSNLGYLDLLNLQDIIATQKTNRGL